MHCFIICDIQSKTFSVGKVFLSDQFDLAVENFNSAVDVQVNTLYPSYIVNPVLVDGKQVWGLSYTENVCPTICSLFGWLNDKLVFLWSYTENSLIPLNNIPEKLYLHFNSGQEEVLNYVG